MIDDQSTDRGLTDIFDLSHDGDAITAAVLEGIKSGRLPSKLKVDPETVSHDLAKLVLTLIEFLRQLLEAQAIRRMERGTLTELEEERLGMTLFNAREKVLELAESFGIPAEELKLNLGPLGRLV
ncbi:MAG: gas vesicle protein K [Rhizobiaceae bacterium]